MTGLRCPSVRIDRLLLAAAVCALISMCLGGVAAASMRPHHDWGGGYGHGDRGGALFVSPSGSSGSSGSSGGADRSCGNAGYSTIQSAVSAATPGSTVIVCPGTYTEDVVITRPLTLRGIAATIQGVPTNTIQCDQLGPNGPSHADCLAAVTIKSSSVKVSGFTVQGAVGEGILATGSLPTGSLPGGSISDVVIRNNRILNNDTDGIPPLPSSTLYPQCAAVGQVPGDCGEGIHLMGVADSVVSDNYLTGNSGGVLLTDEFGPTHGNLVTRNVITRNLYDCGVTAPGHNPFALDAQGNRQPAVAGVYDNVISNNYITQNGLNGEGAGVLFANAGPGTASYDNLVVGNYLAGNELAGVTMHAHTLAPGQFEDMSGNRVIANLIGQNNVGSAFVPGDPLDGPPGGPQGDSQTTGILVFSGTVPVTTVIAHNKIWNNHYGIWLGNGSNVSATLAHNRFFGVDVPVYNQP